MKEYTVNVQYNAIVQVKVNSKNKKEALLKAKEIAFNKDFDFIDFKCNKIVK